MMSSLRFVSFVVAALVLAHACSAAVVSNPASGLHAFTVIPGWQWAPLTFTADGTLWVIQQNNGCLYKFVGVSGNNSPSTTPVQTGCGLQAVGDDWDFGLTATPSGRLFTAHGYEVTAMKTGGAPVPLFGQSLLPGKVRGIAVDPQTGDLIIGGYPDGKVFRVQNPDTHPLPTTTVIYSTDGDGIDGISVAPDGTIYAAGYTSTKLLRFTSSGTPLPPVSMTDGVTMPDGIAITTDGSFLVASRAGGARITKFELTSGNFIQTNVATTGGYNDWSAVGPDGCMYITSIQGSPDGIIKVTNLDGTCSFSAPAVVPPTDNSCGNAPSVVVREGCLSATATTPGDALSMQFGPVGICDV